jgi:hypothetical protein
MSFPHCVLQAPLLLGGIFAVMYVAKLASVLFLLIEINPPLVP